MISDKQCIIRVVPRDDGGITVHVCSKGKASSDVVLKRPFSLDTDRRVVEFFLRHPSEFEKYLEQLCEIQKAPTKVISSKIEFLPTSRSENAYHHTTLPVTSQIELIRRAKTHHVSVIQISRLKVGTKSSYLENPQTDRKMVQSLGPKDGRRPKIKRVPRIWTEVEKEFLKVMVREEYLKKDRPNVVKRLFDRWKGRFGHTRSEKSIISMAWHAKQNDPMIRGL